MLPALVTEVPGPRSRELARRLRAAESRNVTYVDREFPVFWERAEGTNVWDADGNRHLDAGTAPRRSATRWSGRRPGSSTGWVTCTRRS